MQQRMQGLSWQYMLTELNVLCAFCVYAFAEDMPCLCSLYRQGFNAGVDQLL